MGQQVSTPQSAPKQEENSAYNKSKLENFLEKL